MTTITSNSEDFIEEIEELPDIGCSTEWEEFGNIQVQIKSDPTPVVEKNESILQKRKLRVRSSLKKKLTMNKNLTYIASGKPENSIIKVTTSNLSMFEGNALFDGTFFTFVAEYYVENKLTKTITRKFKGKCELCETPTYIVGSGSSTFNFLRHLRRKHGQDEYNAYLLHKETKTSKPTRVSSKPIKLREKENTIPMFVVEESKWKQFGSPRNKRPISSITLNDGVSERILNDLSDFTLNFAWYRERCVPYRRTYLFHGPSGCGKSSFALALASELNLGICVLHAYDRELTDDKLNELLNSTPENCTILIEDIDAALNPKEECVPNRLTTNGVLNCLDGVMAPEGRTIFITCTDISRLDPVLLRPGRVDVKEYLGYCSQFQIMRLFQKFYSNSSSAQEFTREVLKYEKPLSPAQLQGFFLSHKNDDIEQLKLDITQIWDE